MRKDEVNKELISRILVSIPNNINPVSYLMDLLDLSRESTYRRIRGEIPFTFQELSVIATDLKFSVDEIIGHDHQNKMVFDMVTDGAADFDQSFVLMMKSHYDNVMRFKEARNLTMIHSRNYIHPAYTLRFENLLKFFYYRCAHQFNKNTLNLHMADVAIPKEIYSIAEELAQIENRIGNVTYILDFNIFLNSIRQVQYYFKRGLIDSQEISAIKKDLSGIIHDIQEVTLGKADYSNDFYISSFDIDMNSTYIVADDTILSAMYVYVINPMIIESPDACFVHEQWLKSLKKYSALITHSNEKLQASFFNTQYKYIQNMDKVMY
jgi:hypothetical protein